MLKALSGQFIAGLLFFAAAPSSTNYVIPSYDIGSGGTDGSSSANYKIEGTSGTQTGETQTSTSYAIGGGKNVSQNANVPPAPTLTNPANYYNRLQLVVNTGGNPSDTKYLIAISSDNFTTTNYVQPDNSIGTTNSLSIYRTYASYGSGSGFMILGLNPSTTYKVKVKAISGNFTETAYGPATAGVATVSQSLSFGVTTSLTATPPFSAAFSGLVAGTVFSADADLNVSLTTNALVGGSVYVRSSNAALFSSSQSYGINSSSADLGAVGRGYGAQVVSTGQVSGGPLSSQAPFNGASDMVGGLTTALQPFVATASPVTSATAVLRLKAKADAIVPATNDFGDQITIVAAMNY